MSVFSLLNMAYLNQTVIRSLNAEALMISDISDPMGSSKASLLLVISRKTILLLRKNVKLVTKYALLYGVTSLMLGLRKW